MKSFLCDPDTEQITLPGFHFQQNIADRRFGEICVTYLNFNDFETQVVKYHTPGTLLDPIAMASHALKAKTSSIVLNQVRNMISRRAKSTPASLRLLSPATDKVITTKYQLLQYASEYWLLHTTELLPDHSRIWDLFQTLAKIRFHSISGIGVGTWIRSPPAEDSLCEFMYTHKHQALFYLCSEGLWRDRGLEAILTSILTFRCYDFLRLLPISEKRPNSQWQEIILSIPDNHLFQAMKLSDLTWLEDLTVTERSNIFMKAMTTINGLPLPIKTRLIEVGVDPFYEYDSEENTTLLEELVRQPDATLLEKVCKTMVGSGTDFNRKIARNGRNALHIAAFSRSLEGVATILNCYGTQGLIDFTDDYGQTALHIAVQGEETIKSGFTAIVAFLLDMGASNRIKDADGKVASEYISSEDLSSLRLLFKKHNTLEML